MPSGVMRIALVFVALTTAACVTVSPRTSVNVGTSTTRHQATALDFGLYVPIDNKYVFNPFAGGLWTPGRNQADMTSDGVNEWGLRVFSASDRWTNGYYGFGSYSEGPAPNTRGVTVGAGVALSKATSEPVLGSSNDHRWAKTLKSAQLGVVYHHVEQPSGNGDFLGVELTVIGGANAAVLFDDLLTPHVH